MHIRNRQNMRILVTCPLPESNCSCIMCKRQPSSLRNICSDIYFRNMQNFELTVFTTFEQYVSAVNSEQVHFEQPPELTSMRIWYLYDTFGIKFHRYCPGEGSWQGQISSTFEVISDAILALSDENKKIYFGIKPAIKASFSPIPVHYIHTSYNVHRPYLFLNSFQSCPPQEV